MSAEIRFKYNESYYLSQNPDVRAAVQAGVFQSGFAHWQAYGANEGRVANALFDWQAYRSYNPDLAEAGLTTQSDFIRHFNAYGVFENRPFVSPSIFDPVYYAEMNPDLRAAGITSTTALIQHFQTYGINEGRIAHPSINGISYVERNPDLNALLNAGGNIAGFADKDTAGIFHYYNYGLNEGRSLGVARADNFALAATPSDVDNSHTYTAGDLITLVYEEGVSTSTFSITDLVLSNGHSLGVGATLSAVNPINGYATQFNIVLGASPSLVVGDTLSIARGGISYEGGIPSTKIESFLISKVETLLPEAQTATAADQNANGSYNISDTLTLKFSEPISTSLLISDFTVTRGHQFGAGATLTPVSAVNGFATDFVISLGSGTTIAAGDSIRVTHTSVIDQAVNSAAVNTKFIVPELMAHVSSTPSAPADTIAPVASAFTMTYTSVGATSDETGTLGLYDGSSNLIGSTSAFTAPYNLTTTLLATAQPGLTFATLKVADAASNFASATQSVILGTISSDIINGTTDADFVFGFDADDALSGDNGDDTLCGGDGNDTMTGGGGHNTFYVDSGTDIITDLMAGDTMEVAAGAYVFVSLVDLSAVSVTNDGSISIVGTTAAEIIVGSNGINDISANNGNDTITGGAADDYISGDAGADQMTGGGGVDRFVVGSAGNSEAAPNTAGFWGNNVVVGDQFIFTNGVDLITDFGSTDLLVTTGGSGVDPVTLIGESYSGGPLMYGVSYVAYGTYDSFTQTFEVAAAFNASTANDALVVSGDNAEWLRSSTGFVVLEDISVALVGANYV